jgi:BolA family transcriptional regulator, general stress-responsive regulator
MPPSMEDMIRTKLTAAFTPERLVVTNESHQHHGHAGSPGTGESHFRVEITAAEFSGISRIERHRLVNTALAGEFAQGLHALALRADGL